MFHLLLRRAGARPTEIGYDFGGRKIRVINGAGSLVGTLRSRFQEAPATVGSDLVICAGVTDFGMADNVVREGRPGNIVRPATAGESVDAKAGREPLGI